MDTAHAPRLVVEAPDELREDDDAGGQRSFGRQARVGQRAGQLLPAAARLAGRSEHQIELEDREQMAHADVEERCGMSDSVQMRKRTREAERSDEAPEDKRGVELGEGDPEAAEELDVVADDRHERLALAVVHGEDVLRHRELKSGKNETHPGIKVLELDADVLDHFRRQVAASVKVGQRARLGHAERISFATLSSAHRCRSASMTGKRRL